jgi:small ubiquitin-related modifier
VRFILDGERLQPNSTPEEADLEDGDCIDAMMEQVGGH